MKLSLDIHCNIKKAHTRMHPLLWAFPLYLAKNPVLPLIKLSILFWRFDNKILIFFAESIE